MIRRLFPILFVLAALPAAAADETARAAGGSPEELRAVLDLDMAQLDRVRQMFRDAGSELQRIRDTAQGRGGAPTLDQLVAWQTDLRGRLQGLLHPNQTDLYDKWLDKKRRLAEEYDHALFGLPMPTELKLKQVFGNDTAEKLSGIADGALTEIRTKMMEMRNSGRPIDEIGDAVNELRKEAVRKMYEACNSTEQRRFRDWLKTWQKPAAEKLTGTETERLGRVMKALELADGAASDRVLSLVAGALWHMEESSVLRRGLGRELLLALLRGRPELDVWTSIHEYGAIIEVHQRRLASIREDLKASLPTKQIAKLVAEGILE